MSGAPSSPGSGLIARAPGDWKPWCRKHGALLPRHYWKLDFLATGPAARWGLYLQDFPHWFGDVPVRDIGLLASEGRVSIPVEDWTPAGILEITSHFFEFIPRDEAEQANPTTLRCHQVEVGQEYFVVLTPPRACAGIRWAIWCGWWGSRAGTGGGVPEPRRAYLFSGG